MIVNTDANGFEVIYHSTHGLLAGKIANYIADEFFGHKKFETIIAITSHDDLQPSIEDGGHISENGMLKNFTENSQPIVAVVDRCKNIMLEAHRRSPYIEVLVSMHLDFLYTDLAKSSKMMSSFLSEQKTLREDLIKLHSISKSDFEKGYQVLLFCDRLSLILSQNQIPFEGREVEINKSIDGKKYFVREDEQGNLTVRPWIFNCEQFEVSIPVRRLKKTTFKNTSEFKDALRQCKINDKVWKFAR